MTAGPQALVTADEAGRGASKPRRRRLRRWLAVAAIAFTVLLVAFLSYGWWEAGQLGLTEIELAFDGLPPAFDGFRILHLTDLHTREFGRVERRLRRILEQTPADLLVLTGDFKAHISTSDKPVLASLDRIFDGITYPWGCVAIPGNHDSGGFYMALAERGKFDCLLRTSLLLERGGQRLALLGVATMRPNDGIRGEHEMDEASWVGNVARRNAPYGLLPDDRPGPLLCDAVNRGEAFRILLAHVPSFIRPAEADGIDLVLAGDTHGEQVKLPFHATLLIKPADERRYVEGHFVEGRTQMIVSRGIGTLYLPIRFLAPPEVILLTLRARSGPSGTCGTCGTRGTSGSHTSHRSHASHSSDGSHQLANGCDNGFAPGGSVLASTELVSVGRRLATTGQRYPHPLSPPRCRREPAPGRGEVAECLPRVVANQRPTGASPVEASEHDASNLCESAIAPLANVPLDARRPDR